jgi:DNA-binding LacI/PurR family transcriptional regulator
MQPNARRGGGPTVADVARCARVSRATAARALGGYGAVSPQARVRVSAAAEQLGYRVHAPARSMITGRTNTLGVVVPDIENVFFARVLRGIADVGREEGFEILVANTDERAEREIASLDLLIRNRVDGVVIAPASRTHVEHLVSARRAGLQVVVVDRSVPDLDADTVLVDNVAAARSVVERLLQAGHRRIAMVAGRVGDPAGATRQASDVATTSDRVAGYRQALASAGIAFRPEFLRMGGSRREDARAVALDLLALREPPTAVFASDSILALGVLQAVRANGLSTPADISLIAFDDPDWAQSVDPPLTVIEQPGYRIGVTAARRLIDRVRGSLAAPETLRFATRWVERESIARPRE